MKRNTIISIIGVLAAFVIIGWVLQNNKKKNAEKTAVVAEGSSGAVAVRTVKVGKKEIELDFSSNGTFEANQQLILSAENSGRVTRIAVDEGDRVSSGQVLARIDNELLNVDTETADANYENAVRDLSRYENAFKTGGVTRQQLDNARLKVRTTQASVQSSKRKSSDANIKAPFSGVINKRSIEQGSYVSPGTALFEIVDVSKLKLNVTANESQVVNLKNGDMVSIKSTIFPDKDFKGKISFIASKADNSLNFPVQIELINNGTNQLRAGMYGTAVFSFPQQAAIITVPRGAFVGSVNSNKVFMLENNNKAVERKVVSGRIIGESVEILEGLKVGETIIVSGQINLVNGSLVENIK
ncbi:efflux RND transporter periplasmic adaptor subunit [Arcticibacter eurypsychrophilus]|uniref:efflux RND transporter periplasmic adaptor subunit n=1 Tax=Arcticibacter eurypsychrophilus TaxID=1434752 RepID=UPI00084D2E58|nr:efflux RND transporter periplasmic adaptor subunit [Arcticibacter eurypsychrophilus]